MIKVVFVDIDNTLLDFDKCAKVAMKYCMDQFGVMYEEKLYETFLEVNNSLWLEIERGELTRQGLYEIRWNRIFNRLGINIDGVEFEKRFVAVLYQQVLSPYEAPPLMSAVRESPIKITSLRSIFSISAKHPSKKSADGFENPIFSEVKTFVMYFNIPDFLRRLICCS